MSNRCDTSYFDAHEQENKLEMALRSFHISVNIKRRQKISDSFNSQSNIAPLRPKTAFEISLARCHASRSGRTQRQSFVCPFSELTENCGITGRPATSEIGLRKNQADILVMNKGGGALQRKRVKKENSGVNKLAMMCLAENSERAPRMPIAPSGLCKIRRFACGGYACIYPRRKLVQRRPDMGNFSYYTATAAKIIRQVHRKRQNAIQTLKQESRKGTERYGRCSGLNISII